MSETLAENVAEFCNELLAKVQALKEEGKWKGPQETLNLEVIQKMKETGVYSELREQIISIRKVPERLIDMWLDALTIRILSESIETGPENINVDSLIHAFVSDVNDDPTEVMITTYISGIKMNVKMIKLGEGVSLRSQTDRDSERLFGNPFSMFDLFNVSAVLEVVTTQKIQIGISPMSKTYIMLLLLFRKGSVHEVRTFWRANSIFRVFWGEQVNTTPPPISAPHEEYPFNEEDRNRFTKFAERLKTKLPIDEKTGDLLVSDYKGISIARYQDAVLKNEDQINRIAYATMGLEALFLRRGETNELKFRLSVRVGKFMQIITGDNALDVLKTVKEAYDIRSSFVHGSTGEEKGTDNTIILDKVSDYLRKSIVVFLSLENKKKDDVLTLLDHSLLDQKTDKELRELLSDSLELIN